LFGMPAPEEPDPLDDISTAALRAALERRGYVTLTAKSYKAAQRRQGIAQSRMAWAEREAESARSWAYDCLAEERRLHARLNEIIALATQHGMTTEDLVRFNEQLGLRGALPPTTVVPELPGAVTHRIPEQP